MAMSPDRARNTGDVPRLLTDELLDALPEAVLVVDTRDEHLPVVFVNAAARLCFLRFADTGALLHRSIYSLLGGSPALHLSLRDLIRNQPRVTKTLSWRLPGGDAHIPTDIKLLGSGSAEHLMLFSFRQSVADGLGSAATSTVADPALDVLLLDKELLITYANAGAARTAGSNAADLIGFSALILTPTSAIPRDMLTAALAGHAYHDDAVSIRVPGGQVRSFVLDLLPLTDASGVVGVAVLSQEVSTICTGGPKTGLMQSEAGAAVAECRSAIVIVRHDGTATVTGGDVWETSSSIFKNVHPADIDGLLVHYRRLTAGLAVESTTQYRVRRSSGSLAWVAANFAVAGGDALVDGVIVVARDITARKRAEHQLEQREDALRWAADAVNDILFEWDLKTDHVVRSRSAQEFLGLDASDSRSSHAWAEHIHPLDRAAYRHKVDSALMNGGGWAVSYRIRDSSGRYRSLLERSIIHRDPDGEPVRAVGCCVDVSEVTRLADLLEEAQRIGCMGGWEFSYSTGQLAWTDEMFSILETTRDEFELSWRAVLGLVPREFRRRFIEAIRRGERSAGRIDFEAEIITLKRGRRWIRLIGHFEMLAARPVRAYGSMQNVHAQKVAQIALEKSTDWLRLSMNIAQLHAWRWIRSSDCLEFASDDANIANLPRVFPGMKKLMSRVHRDDRLAVRRAIDRAFERHVDVHLEFRLKSQDGHYRAYAAVGRPTFDDRNHPSGLVGITQDITSRHEAEAKLRRSEELLRATTANSADILLLIDADMRIRFINRGAAGLRTDVLIGQDIAVLLPPYAREALLARLRGVLQSGQPASYEFDVVVAGKRQYFENCAVVVPDTGIGACISIAMRNITERRRLEREILEVAGREREAIGRDLHDGLGQELTGVALMLSGLARGLEAQCPETLPKIHEIAQLVNESIETARTLARGLLPYSIEGGVARALQALAERSRGLYGLNVACHTRVEPEGPRLGEMTSSHLYRIAQEAVTNAIRHGGAKTIGIRLTVTRRRFFLRVADDGVGIGATVAGAGMGLKIMRHRAALIGAKFDVSARRPNGTVIRISGQRFESANRLSTEPEHAI